MSTPTSYSNPTQPNSASKKNTGHVTTPSHLGLSPAPRSVPSPAASRKDQAGKTPTNHPTASSHGSKTLGGTPMISSLSQTGMTNTSSPGALNMSFGTPSALAGLGVDLGSGTPGQMNLGTPSGGASMMPSMSELGFSTGGKRNEDEERRGKMRKILKSIGRPKGRVSEEGITQISRRVGFVNDIDVDVIDKDRSLEEKKLNAGNREICIAGNHRVLVEVSMRNHTVQQTKVSFNDVHNDAASKVILADLTPSDGLSLHSTLDRFAINLHSLARLDKLSKEVDCFEAITKLHKSLARLYELEKQAALGAHNDEQRAEREVLCKRSGQPVLHQNGRIGLALKYWTNGASSTKAKHDDNKMEIDAEATSEPSENDPPDVYALHIEVEGSSSAMFPALRISDEWLPEAFELPGTDSGQGIPWQEPPATYISDGTAEQHESMALDNGQRVPDLRFVAKLDPPIVVPYSIASRIIATLGLDVQAQYFGTYYHLMLLNSNGQQIETTRNVLTTRNDREEVKHHYKLDVSKLDIGYKLEMLPFSHPKQLVNLLPSLRQWASLGALVRNTFGDNPTGVNADSADTMAHKDLLDSTMGGNGVEQDVLPVDVDLVTIPHAGFSVSYPDIHSEGVSSVTVQILTNADIIVTDYSDGSEEEQRAVDTVKGAEQAKRLAKALSVCGDPGVWIEWMIKMRTPVFD